MAIFSNIKDETEIVQRYYKGEDLKDIADTYELKPDTLRAQIQKQRLQKPIVPESIAQLLDMVKEIPDEELLSRRIKRGKTGLRNAVLTLDNGEELIKKYYSEDLLTYGDILKTPEFKNRPFITEKSISSYIVHSKIKRNFRTEERRQEFYNRMRKRQEETNELVYGDRNYSNHEKALETFKERYGKGTEGHQSVQRKTESTNIKRFGTKRPLQNASYIAKSRQTKLERYGDPTFTNIEKIEKTTMERYGVKTTLMLDMVKEKAYKTNLERYGTKVFMSSQDARTKTSNATGLELSFQPTPYVSSWEEYRDLKYDYNKLEHLIRRYLSKIGVNKASREEIATNVLGVTAHTCSSWFVIGKLPDSIKELIDPNKRGEQTELIDFIKGITDEETIAEYRPDFMEGLELDVYVPDKNFAVEFNGSYWHSDQFKNQTYHAHKTELARKAGISLMHIFEYDWNDPVKQDILKSQIAYKLHSGKVNHYYARKLSVKLVDKDTANVFYDNNHIQGRSNNSLNYGLYDKDTLVACMGFGRKHFSKKEDNIYELIRFATKKYTSVVGGASKLFKYYLKENPEVKEIVSFSNDDFAFDSDLSVYTKLGFIKEDEKVARYKWVSANRVVERHQAKTSRLKNNSVSSDKFRGDDTERTYMERNGFYKVWASSTGKYVYSVGTIKTP